MRRALLVLSCAIAIQLFAVDLMIWYTDNIWTRDGACQEYFAEWDHEVVAQAMERISDAPEYHCEHWLRNKEG